VHTEIRTPDEVELFERPVPGALATWLRLTIALACGVTIALVAFGTRELAKLATGGAWFRELAPVVTAAGLGLALLWPSRLSRFARAAVALPIVHLVAIVAAGLVYGCVASRIGAWDAPMLARLPIVAVALGHAMLYVGLALAIARGREGLHALVMLALANLLALGIWLPIGAQLWAAHDPHWLARELPSTSWALVAFALVPPVFAATVFTALAIRWPAAMRCSSPWSGCWW
jgi:hypothetical protein